MGEKYDGIDSLVVQHLSSLMFGTFFPQDAQKRLLEMWYEGGELQGALHMAIEEMLEKGTPPRSGAPKTHCVGPPEPKSQGGPHAG